MAVGGVVNMVIASRDTFAGGELVGSSAPGRVEALGICMEIVFVIIC